MLWPLLPASSLCPPSQELITCSRLGSVALAVNNASDFLSAWKSNCASLSGLRRLLVEWSCAEKQSNVEQTLLDILDAGVFRVMIPYTLLGELERVPLDRVLVQGDVDQFEKELGDVKELNLVAGIVVQLKKSNVESTSSLMDCLRPLKLFSRQHVVLRWPSDVPVTSAHKPWLRQCDEQSIHLLVDSNCLSILGEEQDKENQERLSLVEASLLCYLKSDRSDGLFPTVVADDQGQALGLVYSSAESLRQALMTGKGVYYSRSRQSLWVKGETSGDRHQVLRIDMDCDRDALQFTTRSTLSQNQQQETSFCHLKTISCFGERVGLASVESTLRSRQRESLEGSYTRKLLTDPALLQAKLKEEAHELAEAVSKADVEWEAADVLYFTLVKCLATGVEWSDVVRHLERRQLKVQRRPGLAKKEFIKQEDQKEEKIDKEEMQAKKESIKESPSKTSLSSSPGQLLSSWKLNELTAEDRQRLTQRPLIDAELITSRVKAILQQVRDQGDQALLALTQQFDKVHLTSPVLRAPFDSQLFSSLSPTVRSALDVALANIKRFHAAQLDSQSPLHVETMPGVVCSRFHRPIERVGLYVPGGSAVLPSTAMMLGVPAQVAGCQHIVLATPPRPDGSVCPEVVYVAHQLGVEVIVKAGGAQAVAAMAYGTESVPKVDKICGPGNQYVTAAKMLVQNDPTSLVSIDMPAGPSEVLVVADATSHPGFVASDLLSQAEHGPDSQVLLLTVAMSGKQIDAIQEQLQLQLDQLPRASIARQALGHSFLLQCDTIDEAMDFSNTYAPEHLIVHVENPQQVLPMVKHAGSVFLGPYTPESCGDYASGTNHTLPTYGYAKMYSGVSTSTFIKHITAQEVTAEGLKVLGPVVATLAQVEELEGHRNAVMVRLKELSKQEE